MAVGAQRLVRYTFRERAVHLTAAVSYVYLLLTGLAFWTPAMYWLAIVLGGGYLSRVLHPWVGLVFSATVAAMYAIWRRDMRTTGADRAWRKAIVHYVRNEDASVPPAGRFNFGQKQLFWIMVCGGLALLASGLVLWLVTAVPWELRALRYTAVLVHAAAALVTIAGFIVHLYMGLLVVPGGLSAILHGEVSERWARHHHPLWLADRPPSAAASGFSRSGEDVESQR
jgi:formate dehydrogenase subunit gamma